MGHELFTSQPQDTVANIGMGCGVEKSYISWEVFQERLVYGQDAAPNRQQAGESPLARVANFL